MRFLRPLLSLSLLTASRLLLPGHAKSLGLQKRALDLCANVNADVGLASIIGVKLDLCLCISGIPALISTHAQLQVAAQLQGTPAVTAALTALINAAADVQTCTFPANAVPNCSSGNPCGFTCANGFTPQPPGNPTACVCSGTVCNGVCGSSPCSSQRAKRGAHWAHTRTCPSGWSACGIWGTPKSDYECVDVRRDLWSCGGCQIPLLQTDPTGVDCTAIPGVMDVICWASRCVVQRCKKGFEVSPDRTACVPTPYSSFPNDLVFGK